MMQPLHAVIRSFTLAFLLASTATLAQEPPEPEPDTNTDDALEIVEKQGGHDRWPTWYVSVGGAWLGADGLYSLDIPDIGEIPILDFDTIGLDDTDMSQYISINWRSRDSRWGAWLANWRFDATGLRAWERDLDLGDGVIIPVGASVTSLFDADFYIAEVTYSFMRSETSDVGIGLGVHAVDLETNLIARVNVGDIIDDEVIRGELEALAPLPNVAGYWSWRFHPRWHFTGRLGWFGLSVDKFSGEMINAHGLVEFNLSRHWAIGVGYQFVHLDVDIDEVEDEGYVERYNIDFDGPMAFLTWKY